MSVERVNVDSATGAGNQTLTSFDCTGANFLGVVLMCKSETTKTVSFGSTGLTEHASSPVVYGGKATVHFFYLVDPNESSLNITMTGGDSAHQGEIHFFDCSFFELMSKRPVRRLGFCHRLCRFAIGFLTGAADVP